MTATGRGRAAAFRGRAEAGPGPLAALGQSLRDGRSFDAMLLSVALGYLAGWIMPGLVVGAVWSFILAGDFGALNHALERLGLVEERVFWPSDPDMALYAVVVANIWLGIPFDMIVLSVGLSGIPEDIYQAAEMDRASRTQRFLTITLPMMRATLAAVAALSTIFTPQQFDLFAALTAGGPSNASNVLQYWSWELSFQEYRIGVAALYVRSTRHEMTA